MASSLRVLQEGDETEAEVTWEDQRNINTFSKLNIRLDSLEDKYKDKKRELEYLEDLVSELELADEDEKIKYRIGDSYMMLRLEECQELIEKEKSVLGEGVSSLSTQIDGIHTELARLKALLYGKFGKSINLEKD